MVTIPPRKAGISSVYPSDVICIGWDTANVTIPPRKAGISSIY